MKSKEESCINCMKCELSCPLTKYGMGIGRIIRAEENDLMDSEDIWSCLMCFRCDDSCPLDLKPREKLLELRRRSRMHDAYIQLLNNLRATGHALYRDSDRKKVKEIPEILKIK